MTSKQLGLFARGNTKEWSTQELQTLREHAYLGAEALAAMLHRSVKSVKRMAERQRISLRREGSRAGLIMGQPRGVSWMSQVGASPERLEQLREEVLEGHVDMGELERRIKERIYGKAKPICPACGARNVERSQTGLCEPCHWTYLAREHRERADRDVARRDLDAARQEASRARRRSAE
jgi:ribosomal protein L37AE/L43A